MSSSTTCDVCGAAATDPENYSRHQMADAPIPDGWRRLFELEEPEPARRPPSVDLCSPDCLRVWAQRAAEAWAQANLAARPAAEHQAGDLEREPRTPVDREATGPRPPTTIKVGTLVHRERHDLNPDDPLTRGCPSCGAPSSSPCTLGNGEPGTVTWPPGPEGIAARARAARSAGFPSLGD